MKPARALRIESPSRHGIRAAVSVAAAFAFLAHILAAPFVMSAAARGDPVPICTAAGIVFVSIGGDGAPVPADDAPPRGVGCPLCPLFVGLAPPPGAASVPAPEVVAEHGPVGRPGALVGAGWFLGGVQARGPPAAA